jgi:hypothetical protein
LCALIADATAWTSVEAPRSRRATEIAPRLIAATYEAAQR